MSAGASSSRNFRCELSSPSKLPAHGTSAAGSLVCRSLQLTELTLHLIGCERNLLHGMEQHQERIEEMAGLFGVSFIQSAMERRLYSDVLVWSSDESASSRLLRRPEAEQQD